jgi:hypothetical protein
MIDAYMAKQEYRQGLLKNDLQLFREQLQLSRSLDSQAPSKIGRSKLQLYQGRR